MELHLMELKLKRSLKGQEDTIYSYVFDTSLPEHCKKVTLSLLQEIQKELSARTDVGSHKNLITYPRNLETVPHTTNLLETLY